MNTEITKHNNNNINYNDSSTEKAHNDLIISQFTKFAAPYTQLSQHSNQHGIELILGLAKPQPTDLVLDVACGSGIVSCAFAKYVSHVTGIDLTPAMIEQARKLQAEQQPGELKNITWKIVDVSKSPLPFDDSSFSIVVSRYTLHHLLEPKKVLQEMKRVCTNEGKIIVIDVTPDPDKVDAYNSMEKLRDPSHVRALTLTELQNIMKSEEVGLNILQIEHQDLEVELESILQSSCPSEEDANKIRQLFRKDLSKNNLGVRSHLKREEENKEKKDGKDDGKKIYFYFPISMILAGKA
jgi:ubiquinone/menaquinone biosynthesis C-methylase UbiE